MEKILSPEGVEALIQASKESQAPARTRGARDCVGSTRRNQFWT